MRALDYESGGGGGGEGRTVRMSVCVNIRRPFNILEYSAMIVPLECITQKEKTESIRSFFVQVIDYTFSRGSE